MYIIAYNYEGVVVFTKVLTRKYYYHASKMNEYQRRVQKWNTSLSGLFQDMSKHHFKTCDQRFLMESLQSYSSNFEEIWTKMAGSRKWSHGKFRLYRSKTRTIDKFLQSLIPTDPIIRYDKPIMMYGSGQFPSGAKGERNVPLKYIKDRCNNYFDCITINEFRTSQVCHHCKLCRLHDVVSVSPDNQNMKSIRGLKWCPSDNCKHNRIKTRDQVGSTNIMIRGRVDLYADNPMFDRNKVRWNKGTPLKHKFYTRNKKQN